MNRRTIVIGYFIVPIILVSVILAELYHLATVHLFLFGGCREYQQELLTSIRESMHSAKTFATEEDLIRNFNAVHICQMTKEDVLCLPRVKQGKYKDWSGDATLAWDIYEIDPIMDYRGYLEIGSRDGRFERANIEYSFYEGDGL